MGKMFRGVGEDPRSPFSAMFLLIVISVAIRSGMNHF